jgi:CDP-diacylglycerol---glycerol-3-phosphate 3-phosphatidyltransferase
LNLPNLITLGRIVLAVLIFPLLLVDQFGIRFAAFLIFLVAAFSDLWDGHLARSRGLVTDLGKLLDPLADKLLLGSTFIAFYVLSHWRQTESAFPWIGGVFPLWIMLVIFGREIFITLFRSYAARGGVVIPAGPAGKYKTVFQSIFIGAAMLWYALDPLARERGWAGGAWETWRSALFGLSVLTFSIALVLTIYSMIVYLRNYRSLVRPGAGAKR